MRFGKTLAALSVVGGVVGILGWGARRAEQHLAESRHLESDAVALFWKGRHAEAASTFRLALNRRLDCGASTSSEIASVNDQMAKTRNVTMCGIYGAPSDYTRLCFAEAHAVFKSGRPDEAQTIALDCASLSTVSGPREVAELTMTGILYTGPSAPTLGTDLAATLYVSAGGTAEAYAAFLQDRLGDLCAQRCIDELEFAAAKKLLPRK